MNLYYVCQNQTYKHESTGQYLWSHQRTKMVIKIKVIPI